MGLSDRTVAHTDVIVAESSKKVCHATTSLLTIARRVYVRARIIRWMQQQTHHKMQLQSEVDAAALGQPRNNYAGEQFV